MRISLSSTVKIIGILGISVLLWMGIVLYKFLFLVPHIPSLTGFPFWEKTYLILLQNDAELRPTGGFISSFGELTFKSGLPVSFVVKDVFALDDEPTMTYSEPPYPMGELLKNEFYKGYSFRDANWSPDFPTAAKELSTMYKKIYPKKNISGVVALNFHFIEEIMKLYGPMSINGKPISSETLFSTLQYEQNNIDRHDKESLKNRKSFLKEMLSPLMANVTFNLGKWRELTALTFHAFAEKDLMFYTDASDLQRLFEEKQMANIFPKPSDNSDIFAVVLSNLGGMKSDRYIQRDISYTVKMIEEGDLSGKEHLQGQYVLHLTHMGGYNAPLSHDYKGYARIYLPKDTTITNEPKDAKVFSELGYTVVGIPLAMPAGGEQIIQLTTALPDRVLKNESYTIQTYGQSGLENTHTHFAFQAPVDRQLTSTNKKLEVRENVGFFENTPFANETLMLQVLPDTTPPRITLQEFADYNKLVLQFNEPVFKSDCEDMSNYEIFDKDINVPEITNRPRIRIIKCKDREATLYSVNIRTQYNEAFGVRVRNIRDMHNNIISPNPMTITTYQRFEKDKGAPAK